MHRFLAALLFCATMLPAIATAQMLLPGQATQATAEGLEIGTSTSEIAITSDFAAQT